MLDIMKMGLEAQKLTCAANQLSDADVASIKASGLRLVCRPDPKPTNLVSLDAVRQLRNFVEPMDAA